MVNGKSAPKILETAILFILFLTVLVMVFFCASSYKSVQTMQSRNDSVRAAVGYVITAVKADKTDSITLLPEGMLLITDNVSGYVHAIYGKDGKLCENYCLLGEEMYEDGEEVICEVSHFRMEMVNDRLLHIETDIGDSFVDIGEKVKP